MRVKVSDWERIKRARTDITDYVLHCIRGTKDDKGIEYTAFDVLKLILEDGFFRATRAERPLNSPNQKPTVQGQYPAVCFTEQPLRFYLESVSAIPHRYTEFAIAVRKDDLFHYGGRPVIYSDNKIIDCLHDELKYLWVCYDPTAIWSPSRGQEKPIDWTHEREWRARPNKSKNEAVGLVGRRSNLDKAVPVWLIDCGHGDSFHPFVLLVKAEEHKKELDQWRKKRAKTIVRRRGTYWRYYVPLLLRAPILSFDRVRNSDSFLWRIEDFV